MKRITERIRRLFHGSRRQMVTAVSAAFIVYVLLLAGIFSYFHSEDTVTNRFASQSMAVKLLEPEWDSSGEEKARASEPGMTIPKNPYAVNEGQYDLYIRLKMTVSLGRFDASGKYPEYVADFNNNARRLNSILNAIEIKNGSTTSKLFQWQNTTGGIENWVLADTCSNQDYYMEKQEPRTLNDGTTEQVFYFYWVSKDSGGVSTDQMRIAPPQASTNELFRQISIPVYKKDWLGVFDQSYNITLVAQAVPADKTESAAVSVQKTKFTDD